jgi:hypothetical protein
MVSSACTVDVARCGDGTIQGTEECEPPGAQGCDESCRIAAVCGDFIVTAPEVCDPPNTPTCNATCGVVGPETCGDGVVAPGEQCEPPGSATCDASCHTISGPSCGNGAVEPPEQCEPPGTSTCNATCQTISPAVCGNGIVEGGEQCDPPDGWSCSFSCTYASTPVCGNGIIEFPEECDPPDGFSCDFGCRYISGPYCGDYIIDPGEACDPPDGVTCDFTCQLLTPGTTDPGGPCSTTSDCAWNPGQTAFCFDELSTDMPGGFCLVIDCAATPGGGDDCPGPSTCYSSSDGAGGTITLCLADCDPTSGTYGGCRPEESATVGYGCLPSIDDAASGACVPGCVADAGCNYCRMDGYCNDDVTFCSSDADCAAAANFACDVGTHVCHPDHAAGSAAIGDPCGDDLDCPANASCATGADYPGGYCTVLGCGSYASASFACPSGAVCPAATGGAINSCAAACTVDGGSASCNSDRGDALDYECADATVAAGGAAATYYAATGAAGYCWQCDALVTGGAGCP